jgi:pimeloyl-ACP methyl ester carboxylesterase
MPVSQRLATRTQSASTAPRLRVELLGDLVVSRGGVTVDLPASRKTRALFAYLLLNPRPQRRDWLCELFWDLPDDPRGALRWSLSRLRAALNQGDATLIAADRDRAWVEPDSIDTDLAALASFVAGEGDLADAQAAASLLRQPLLAGLDLPQQPAYQAWLTAERDAAQALRPRLIARIVDALRDQPNELVPWAREWVECEPCEPAPAQALAAALRRLGRVAEAEAAERRYRAEAQAAGLRPLSLAADPPPRAERLAPAGIRFVDRQKIGFCTAADGVRIAYASVGQGPPFVKAANWLNHLELDWDAPIWAPLFRELATDHCFTRYDERGNGLSDWDVADLSFEAFVSDLEAVVAANRLERFPLLGISQGCAVAIEYAARHPERVSHLILWGGYAAGWRLSATPEIVAEREAIITLVRQGWGREDPAYRHLFSSTFMPGATPEELDWFDAFQRRTTSAANAARFLEVFASIDVRHRLAEIRTPTLVIHARGDRRIPVASGGILAAGIPNAEFVALDSDNHILLGREAASREFVAQVRRFLA